jgi:hypothetical protein
VLNMTNRSGTRLALAAVAAASVIGLVGCGNGLEVGGPAPSASSVVASPTAGPSRHSPDSPDSSDSPSSKSSKHTKQPGPAPRRTAGDPGGGRTGGKPTQSGSGDNGNTGNGGAGSSSVAACTLGDLEIGAKVPAGGGTAGSQYILIRFTNTSDATCTMYGYAGVSFVGHKNGTQLGQAAQRDRSQLPTTIQLEPGSMTSELIRITDAGNFDPQDCVPITSDGFRIYPPGSYTAAYVPFETTACQSRKVSQLTVYPVGTKG